MKQKVRELAVGKYLGFNQQHFSEVLADREGIFLSRSSVRNILLRPGTIKLYDAKHDKVVDVERVDKTDEEWKKLLTTEQYQITTRKGTEPPGTRTFDEVYEPGIFRCVRCDTDLFLSSTKFESGTGWPSFYEPVSPLNVVEQPDLSLGMEWTEVLCARCGSHLGHVFDDGPQPTGLRYCMNGFALEFVSTQDL